MTSSNDAQMEIFTTGLRNHAFEHFEIASSKSLLTVANAVGQGGGKTKQQSLDEELDMARWMDENLASTTMRNLGRSAAGVKAGL